MPSFSDNVKQNLFRETGLFRTDPDYLIGEQVRDSRNHQAVLSAIADGASAAGYIALAAGWPHRSSADPDLAQLVEMDYVRRELPVTVPPKKHATSRQARACWRQLPAILLSLRTPQSRSPGARVL